MKLGIFPIYLEKYSLSISLVRVISFILMKFSNTRIENLFKYEVKDATNRVTNCKSATLRKIKLDRLCIMTYFVDISAKPSINTKATIYFDETFADIPFATIVDNNGGTAEPANPILDWANTTQITMSNFASGFSLMVIGYI